MYIPDLSGYSPQWGDEEKEMNLIAIGWLSKAHHYNNGKVMPNFLRRLEDFCLKPMIQNFAIETCNLCREEEFVNFVTSAGKKIRLYGTYEIRIPSLDRSKIYAAPDFIIHYIVIHNYKPPDEFIDAVLNAPLPGTKAYEEFSLPWKRFH